MTLKNSLSARDIAVHLHPYTNAKKQEAEGSLILTEGKGVYVYDENGKAYLEGMSGLWCTGLGFNEKRLIDAATAQMQKLPYYHSFTQKAPGITVELAEKLIALAPVKMSKVFFAGSGSEANDTVVKMVWFYNNALGRPQKKKIISRIKAYHGVTVAAASLTGLPNNHRDFDLPLPQIKHTDCPHFYRYGQAGETEEQFASRCAENLEKMILTEGPDTVAAFIAEPVQGAGGVIIPPRTYFEKIQAVLNKYDILMIADEVITGFGRTGKMFGCETFGVKPDIMTMAKQLSSAYMPIAAVLINEKIYEGIRDNSGKIGTFGHGYTYSGHPVSAAVALETLKIYEERRLLDHIADLTPVFEKRLKQFADHPLVGETRGVGLVGGVEIVKDKATRESFDPALAVGPTCVKFCQEQGVILRAIVDSVVFCPPLIATSQEINEMFDRFARGLDQTARWLKDQGLAAVA